MSLKRRLAGIEHDIALQQTKDAREFDRMFRQCQEEFGLPLPDEIPVEVRQEAERRIVAMQAALKASPGDDAPAEAFREWVLSIHRGYGQSR